MRHVLITGVSRGLGLAMATDYLRRGDHVYGMSRTEPEDIGDHPEFDFNMVDLTELDTIFEAVGDLLANQTTLDLVVLNAGMLGPFGDLRETDVNAQRRVLDVNVWANKVLLDGLYASGHQVRQVVAISSGASISGHRGWNSYGISKAALNMLIKLYAAETPQTHFTALAPGTIATSMMDEVTANPGERFPTVDRLKSKFGTSDMPDGSGAAARLVPAMDQLPDLVPSGDYADIRTLDGLKLPS